MRCDALFLETAERRPYKSRTRDRGVTCFAWPDGIRPVCCHAVNLNRQPITHVIWDWNGTLLDDVSACVASINRMLAKRSLPQIDQRRYRDVFGFPVKNYYLTLGFNMAAEDWPGMAREFHDFYAEEARTSVLRDGVVDLLDRLRRRGTPMSVLSASERSILTNMLGARGIAGYFESICGLSDLYAHSKTELGRELMAGIAGAGADVVLAGDTTHDHEVACELGCRCVLVEGGHQSGPRLRRCGCPVVSGVPALAGFFDLEDRV